MNNSFLPLVLNYPLTGVVKVAGAEAGVGFLLESTPVATTSYVVPGFRPVMGQSAVAHVTEMGLPPLMGLTVTANGPVVPGRGYI